MHRDLDRLTGHTFDLPRRRRRYLRAHDCLRRRTTRSGRRADRPRRFRQRHIVQPSATIHGGLRYLQTLDIARARESVRERRTIARIAPHAVRPTPFALPLYRSITRGKLALRAGFLLDRGVAAGRNRGVAPSHRLPAGRVVSKSTAIQQYPGLRRQGLTGAAVWHDYVMTEPDRLTFSFALAAVEHGALVANHVEAIALLTKSGRVTGVSARDRLGDRQLDIAARITVNATGGRMDALLKPLNLSSGVPMLKAMNLVTRRDAGEEALGGRSSVGKNLFLVPWRERAVFGTWESDKPWDPADGAIGEPGSAGVHRRVEPRLSGARSVPLRRHARASRPSAGVVRGNRAALQGREQVRDHASEGFDGLLTVTGPKYTTARAVAERLTDRLLSKLQRAAVPCHTATTALPGGGIRTSASPSPKRAATTTPACRAIRFLT
jgi:glycerol-3-phosphate dehydrogenase